MTEEEIPIDTSGAERARLALAGRLFERDREIQGLPLSWENLLAEPEAYASIIRRFVALADEAAAAFREEDHKRPWLAVAGPFLFKRDAVRDEGAPGAGSFFGALRRSSLGRRSTEHGCAGAPPIGGPGATTAPLCGDVSISSGPDSGAVLGYAHGPAYKGPVCTGEMVLLEDATPRAGACRLSGATVRANPGERFGCPSCGAPVMMAPVEGAPEPGVEMHGWICRVEEHDPPQAPSAAEIKAHLARRIAEWAEKGFLPHHFARSYERLDVETGQRERVEVPAIPVTPEERERLRASIASAPLQALPVEPSGGTLVLSLPDGRVVATFTRLEVVLGEGCSDLGGALREWALAQIPTVPDAMTASLVTEAGREALVLRWPDGTEAIALEALPGSAPPAAVGEVIIAWRKAWRDHEQGLAAETAPPIPSR